MLCLGDINEKVSGYGNHNHSLNSNLYRQLQYTKLLTKLKRFDYLTEIVKLYLWCGDPSNET